MADNKELTDKADRRTVALAEGYEVAYFARKHGITREQALKLIQKFGNNRDKLNGAARKLKAR